MQRQAYVVLGMTIVACLAPAATAAEKRAPLNKTLELRRMGVTVRHPETWSLAPGRLTNAHELINVPTDQQEGPRAANAARILFTVLKKDDHAQAVLALKAIATETSDPSTFLKIGGWPALQRRRLAPVQLPQFAEPKVVPETHLWLTTAIAAGSQLFRLEAYLPPGAAPQVADEVEEIGRNIALPTAEIPNPGQVDQELQDLRGHAQRDSLLFIPAPPGLGGPADTGAVGGEGVAALSATTDVSLASPGLFTQNVINNASELEIAVSTNGVNIVVCSNGGCGTSNNGGQTFVATNPPGGRPGFPTSNFGDPSVAFGVSGNFYLGYINNNQTNAAATACTPPTAADQCCAAQGVGCATGIGRSAFPNNGQTFTFLSNAVVCPTTGAGACFPDQEHIAADRSNAAPPPAGSPPGTPSGDQVYVVWRNFPGPAARITCSRDGGATWPATAAILGPANEIPDFPRLTVAQDGFVYVVYRFTAGGATNIGINRYRPCQGTDGQGLNALQQLSAVTVAGNAANPFTDVVCPVPGLDRCGGTNEPISRNTLSSPTVAVDDTNASHIYVAYANNTQAPAPLTPGPAPTPQTTLGNENIVVRDSTDRGATFPAANHVVTVSTGGNGRRFMPWACAVGGSVFVSWYDRRQAAPVNASTTNNDVTEYFAASASLNAGGTLVAGAEFRITQVSDPQCASGWPRSLPGSPGPNNQNDSESCSTQPQNAGTCSVTTATRCDFAGGDGTQCPAGETCRNGRGGPKYGDYNGNACILGRFYTAWASATPPPGVAGSGNIDTFFSMTVVTPTPTTMTYTGATTADFHDPATLSATLVLSGTTSPVAGQTITFTIGITDSCTGVTNAAGVATCTIPSLSQVPGSYTVTANFAGSGLFQASSASAPFTITREETTTTYTGPTVIANGVNTTFSAVLKEDGVVPISGRTITITLGTGATAQTCNGVTNASGTATCTILVNQPLGAGTVAANFAGDAFYLPSSDSATTILFAFLAHGAFVLGNQTATGSVEFWGFDWSLQNVLSGGPAPDSFKGFAATISTNPPACGDSWTTRPGNSSDPPDPPLPAFMGVVVSSSITKSASNIFSGNVPKIVVVTTNPGYLPDPGHPGTGTVVATFCK